MTHTAVTPGKQILTVMLEDYFQGAAFAGIIGRRQWSRFEHRLEDSTCAALDLLSRHHAQGTFFVNGWVAERRPELVREVVRQGHEIASAGLSQKSFRQWTEPEFREELRRSRDLIETASNQRVRGYRVADHRLDVSDLWALRVLAEEGYDYDSSLHPSGRAFAGDPGKRFVHRHTDGEHSIWEVPLSSMRLGGWHLPIAGGNYFRQLPGWFIERAVEHWVEKEQSPFVLYFRVWDLDLNQPRITGAPWLAQVRHYRNQEKMSQLLEQFLSRGEFSSIAEHLGLPPAPVVRPMATASSVPAREAIVRAPVAAPMPATSPRIPVTVVIPCYNEELVLPYLANTLDHNMGDLTQQYDLRYCFVDDGSSDSTWPSLQQLFGQDSRCTLIRQPRNQGVAAAILAGLRNARTEIVCSMDCDCTYDPSELGRMIPLLENADLVTASPYHPEGAVMNVPGWRLLFSRGCSLLYRAALGTSLHTYTSCFRVYRRSSVVDLSVEQTGFLGIAEMLGQLLLGGGRVVEHPATLEVRMLGHSKMKVARTTWGHIWLLARFTHQRLFGPAVKAAPAATEVHLVERNLL